MKIGSFAQNCNGFEKKESIILRYKLK